ncbi:MAG: 30S ribosomal protein S3 [archaeon]
MKEKIFIGMKKQEYEMQKKIQNQVGKGKISSIRIERTPVGEKVIITTTKPGLVIGKGGENIQKINLVLKNEFKLENPQVEISEIQEPLFDAQTIADNIALSLERFGPLRFKLIAYRELDKIVKAGALGVEITLSGKLPSERSRTWKFAHGYLSKTGDTTKMVKKATATAHTKPGCVGVKVSIVPPNTKIPDRIEIKKNEIQRDSKTK